MISISAEDPELPLVRIRPDPHRRAGRLWPAMTAAATIALMPCCHGELREHRQSRIRIMVHGHRGCRGLRPENTMLAFAHAARLGVDFLELDLGLTRDRVLVVSHDPVINPALCQVPPALSERRIKELSWPEIRDLKCGGTAQADSGTNHGRIPRLEQVLALLQQHPRLGANIEIKTFSDHPDWTWTPAEFAGILIRILRERGIADRVIVQSFDPRALAAVSRLAPEISIAALVDRRAEIPRMLRASGARILSPRYSELRREDLRDLKARGISVVPWTVNEPEDMRTLIEWEVDGIITDRPDILLGILKRTPPGAAAGNSGDHTETR